MTNPIKGMIAVISNYGVGKTTFALECGYHPKDIIFINDDLKDAGIDGFKKYVQLTDETKSLKLLDFHQYCNDLIDSLPKTKVIIWDTWTRYATTFFHYVKANEGQFRGPKEWAGKPSIKAGEWHNEAWQYQGQQISKLKSKCDMLFLSFHLKQMYIDNVPVPGKRKPGHDRAIEKYADMRLWLTRNPNGQVPIGLVLKNISKRNVTKSGIKTEQVLPLRLEECNWDNILKYWEHPIGNREPVEGERPNSFELSLIEGVLTPEDKRLYEASLSLVEMQAEQEKVEGLMVKQEQVKALKGYAAKNFNNLPTPLKVAKLKEAVEAGEKYNDVPLTYDGEITASVLS